MQPLGFPPPRGAAAPDGRGGGGQGREEGWRTPLVGLRPTYARVPPFPLSLVRMGWVGGAPAHLGAGSLPHLAHLASRGRCPPSVDPRGHLQSSRWSRYVTGDA